jgi:hypothetical protein
MTMDATTDDERLAMKENDEIERESSYVRTYIQYTYPPFPNTYIPSGGF